MLALELDIDSIAAGGDGVGRADGLVVFVPRSAPGDRVVADVAAKARFARGSLRALVRPSALRVEQPCLHYTRDRCGGCQLQHLAYGAQLAAKRDIIASSVARIGKRAAPALAVEASERQWRYREKLTLALRRDGSGRWYAGLHPFDAPGQVFQLLDCPITSERVLGVWREVMAAADRLPSARTLRGAVRARDDGASLVLEGGARWTTAAAFLDAVPAVSALWWGREGERPHLVADRRALRSPAASFAQVNPVVAAKLHTHVVRQVLSHAPASVVDAYAGAGETAAALAAAGVAVTAIEIDREAAAWTASRLPSGSRALVGRVEERIHEALPADVVLVNPPRSGLDERVTAAIRAQAPALRALIYVSCDPATLARDLARLPAFAIRSLAAYDMFPQTAHVETICELVPEAA